MRLVHCADIHLGSAMDSRLPREKAAERRGEVLSAFARMVEFARQNEVSAILISGDLFDSDRPLKKDKEFFYRTVERNPQIDFYYLRGNHDTMESYTKQLDNLKGFGEGWTAYELGEGIVVSGIELSPSNKDSLYSSLRLDPQKRNIVMLHGVAQDSSGDDRVNLRLLRERGIDYLALGHIHSCKAAALDSRGVYAYPGCLEGRGFDELGEKGFLLIDIEDELKYSFIVNSVRVIRELRVDISSAKDEYESFRAVKDEARFSSDDILRVELVGDISFDGEKLGESLEKLLSPYFYFVSVKDKTYRRPDLAEMSREMSLKGEFLRVVDGSDYSDEDKKRIVSLGLAALSGREIEI